MSGTSGLYPAHTLEGIEQKGPRALVLGAGISGLVTAYELEQRGYRVEVIEGNSRIGGRIHTHRFGSTPGAPSVELGAMRIPTHHLHTLEYIERLGLTGTLRPFTTLLSDENAFLQSADGAFVRVRDASRPLRESLCRDLDRHCPGVRHNDATMSFAAWLTAIVDAIAPPDLREALRADLRRQLLGMVARLDLTPHLRGEGLDRIDLHALFAAHPGIRAGCSGRLNGFLDDILTETSPALLRLEGGMDQLPRRLAARLRAPVSCGRRVTGIEVRHNEVLVRVRGGARSTVRRAEVVVCTLPFPALRRLRRLTGLDADKREVLREVVYCPATKVALHCREPFWRREGIQGGASCTGGLIRQTYYPPVDSAPGRGAALLASYTIGEEAELLGRLSPRRRNRLVISQLARIHPRLAEPGMVLDTAGTAWGQSPFQAGCTTRWGKSADECEEERRRAARPVGRLFFAGEHCSTTPAWIEGAIESALNAVAEVVRYQPGGRRTGRPGAAEVLR
ncbi:flavin monoamine oxidase family protein [Streptomyces sp. NPDC052396]|uniref:flavin monoamine oxidase family protein n=1 Tax=Streptomyces sp. NPDC052396 TaxID=3365689 RepID=UPI0037D37F05